MKLALDAHLALLPDHQGYEKKTKPSDEGTSSLTNTIVFGAEWISGNLLLVALEAFNYYLTYNKITMSHFQFMYCGACALYVFNIPNLANEWRQFVVFVNARLNGVRKQQFKGPKALASLHIKQNPSEWIHQSPENLFTYLLLHTIQGVHKDVTTLYILGISLSSHAILS